MLLLATPAHADPAADLAAARAAFAKIQATVTVEVNQLDAARRGLIWEQYYFALERLQRMDVHLQMMKKHKQDRGLQFGQAYAEFNRALGDLEDLMPSAGNSAAE